MKRMYALLGLGLLMLPLLTGCWNRKELNELAVVLALGIDSSGGQYEVTVQVVDSSQMAHNRSSSRSPVTIYTDKSPTLFEALRKMTTQSPRQMYLAHLRFLFFDEAAAKKGIKPAIDFLLRDYQVRPDFHLAVIRGSSTRQVLELLTPAEALPVMELYKSLKVSEKAWAPTSTVTVQDLLQKFTKSGVEPVLTGLTLRGDIAEGKQTSNLMQSSVSARYQYTGIGVFRDDRLLGWLNDADSKAYNYITNHITSTVAAIECPGSDGYFVAEVDRAKVKVIPRLVNGNPQIRIAATVEANVAEVGCVNVDLTQEQALLDLQQAARRQLKQVLATGVRNTQTLYAADIYGFGEAFHRTYPKLWNRWKDHWDERFKQLPVDIQIDYRLRRIGEIINPYQQQSGEKE